MRRPEAGHARLFLNLRDEAPKAHDAAAILGLASRARFSIGGFLALPPSERAQATALVNEVGSIVQEVKSLRSADEPDKH